MRAGEPADSRAEGEAGDADPGRGPGAAEQARGPGAAVDRAPGRAGPDPRGARAGVDLHLVESGGVEKHDVRAELAGRAVAGGLGDHQQAVGGGVPNRVGDLVHGGGGDHRAGVLVGCRVQRRGRRPVARAALLEQRGHDGGPGTGWVITPGR